MQESIFIGAFLGVFLVAIFSDLIGKKKTVLYSIVMSVGGIFLILVFQNIVIKCIGFLLWGIATDISFAVGATYISEIVA